MLPTNPMRSSRLVPMLSSSRESRLYSSSSKGYPKTGERTLVALPAIAILVAAAVWFQDDNALLAGAATYLSMLITATPSVTYNRLRAQK